MSVLSKKGLRSALLATFAVLMGCGGVAAEQETLGTTTQPLTLPDVDCQYLNEAECLSNPGCTATYVTRCTDCAPASLCGPCQKSFAGCEPTPLPPPPPPQPCFSNAECPVNQYCAVDPTLGGGCPPCDGDGPCPLCALPPPGICTEVPTCVSSPVDAGTPVTPGNEGGSGTPTDPAR